ncbi:YciI family protein [Streptomyces sp. NBC_01483]|uniref:YciI family protein n=1 Tax=Streptomyces sp. NBC_01483 TaxID=2903883 RepID=UPI002E38180F|nr:YciI family protein [Streptomyces sp. NBC_01483]
MTEITQAKPDERHTGAQKVLFLCFTEPNGVSADVLRQHLEEHKKWLTAVEHDGRLFAAGPLLDEDYRGSGSGMLILRAASRQEAQDIVDQDPFHVRGLRTYRLQPWQLNEGSFGVNVSLSNGTATLT